MQVIKLSATDSTNTYLKGMSAREKVPDFTVVWAVDQQAGRGQPGNIWVSEKGKNLTFSILKKFVKLQARDHFLLNILVSLALMEALKNLGIPDLRVKWPNDIMSGPGKICGILIENQVKGSFISQSIVGIGLNVNQQSFDGLPRATSLKNTTGQDYDLHELLTTLLSSLKEYYGRMQTGSYPEWFRSYERNLFLRDVPASFQRPEGPVFEGIIRGVAPDGQLLLETAPGRQEAFGFKEVRYRY
jgi:BirA family biotin operon repressor/biotin-[acetyl-CoA-carboxylase] ligase